MTSDIERELLDAAKPDLPPALRQRVLTTASALVQPDASRLDAIWFSPRWRVAAVLVFFGIIAADALSRDIEGVPPQVESLRMHSSVEIAAQAAIDAGLGMADVAAIAAQARWLSGSDDDDVTRGVRTELIGVPE
jgi:hypothetical protein